MQIVTYLRVSTVRQGRLWSWTRGANAPPVQAFAAASGHRLVSEFVEVESGKKVDRPQLNAALAACRLHRATLVIAKLDRLARNMAFIANLMDGGVEFVACDMPHANRLTLHLMAAMAEHEREMISQRTKAALAAAKVRGVKLGNPNGAAHMLKECREAAILGAQRRSANADAEALSLFPLLQHLHAEGIRSPAHIASELNKSRVPAPGGGIWYPQQVSRVSRRISRNG